MGPKADPSAKKRSRVVASTSSAGRVDLQDLSGDNNEAPPPAAKKSRSENWSKDEQLALVNSVAPCFEQLFGKHSQALDEQKKAKLWQDVSDKVNAVSSCQRSVAKINKKFIQLKSTTKTLASQILREKTETGGGEKDDLDMDAIQSLLVDLELWQRSLVRIIGVEGLLGIDGGIDGPDPERVPSRAVDDELDAEDTANEPPDVEIQRPVSRPPRLSGLQASEKMIEIQSNILDQIKVIASGITELVQFVKSGGLAQTVVVQVAADFTPFT